MSETVPSIVGSVRLLWWWWWDHLLSHSMLSCILQLSGIFINWKDILNYFLFKLLITFEFDQLTVQGIVVTFLCNSVIGLGAHSYFYSNEESHHRQWVCEKCSSFTWTVIYKELRINTAKQEAISEKGSAEV